MLDICCYCIVYKIQVSETGVFSESCVVSFSWTILFPYFLPLVLDEKKILKACFSLCVWRHNLPCQIHANRPKIKKEYVSYGLYVDYLFYITSFKATFDIIPTETVAVISTSHSFNWCKSDKDFAVSTAEHLALFFFRS